MIQHFLGHWLGMDGSDTTDAWGGFLSCLGMIVGCFVFLRHKNCHVRRCPRMGRHKVEGTEYVVCRHHHPEDHPSVEHIHHLWSEHKEDKGV